MTPEELVSCLRAEILDRDLEDLRRSLERAVGVGQEQTAWPRMAAFFASLDDHQRQEFVHAARQIKVDTISSVLGVLDGVVLLDRFREDFQLSYGHEKRPLNGALADLMLAAEEEKK